MSKSVRGADIVVRTLERAGCRTVFTLSGNHIMSIFDAAFGSALDLVHVRQEAAAVHMADAWGRLTGEPGVAMVTGGPGHATALPATRASSRSDGRLRCTGPRRPDVAMRIASAMSRPSVSVALDVHEALVTGLAMSAWRIS